MYRPILPRPALTRNDSVLGSKRNRSESTESENDETSDSPSELPKDTNNFLPIQLLANALRRAVEKGVPPAVIKQEPGQHHVEETPHLHQPVARGAWHFISSNVSQAAVDCFANEIGFGTEGVEHPTAAQIFHIRESTQYYLNTGMLQPLLPYDWNYNDPTLEIELSYVGDEVEHEATPAADWIPNDTQLPPQTFDFDVDKLTKFRHDPTNKGANDQRGLHNEAKYFTRVIDGVLVTLDRAVVLRGKDFQSHKVWIYRGRWQKYTADIEWDSEKSINALNKWRNQTLERDGWPLLRGKLRKVYDAEQRTWLFKHIALAGGKVPQEGFAKLCTSFNEHFGLVGEACRGTSGISEVGRRLMKEYEVYGGKQKPAVDKRPSKRVKVSSMDKEDAAAVRDDGGVETIIDEEVSEDDEDSDDPVMTKLVEEYGGDEAESSELDDEDLDRILEAFE